MKYNVDDGTLTIHYGSHDRVWKGLQQARTVVHGDNEDTRARFWGYAREILWHNQHPDSPPMFGGYVPKEEVDALLEQFPLIMVSSGIPKELPESMLKRAAQRAFGKPSLRPAEYERVIIKFQPARGIPAYRFEGTVAGITQEATPARILDEVRKEQARLNASIAEYRNLYGI